MNWASSADCFRACEGLAPVVSWWFELEPKFLISS